MGSAAGNWLADGSEQHGFAIGPRHVHHQAAAGGMNERRRLQSKPQLHGRGQLPYGFRADAARRLNRKTQKGRPDNGIPQQFRRAVVFPKDGHQAASQFRILLFVRRRFDHRRARKGRLRALESRPPAGR